LYEHHKINRSLFYPRQRTFFENGSRAFEASGNGRADTKLEKQVEALESRLQRKHEVLSELMEEHIRLKKSLRSRSRVWPDRGRPRLTGTKLQLRSQMSPQFHGLLEQGQVGEILRTADDALAFVDALEA
jgi:hypothetical protein